MLKPTLLALLSLTSGISLAQKAPPEVTIAAHEKPVLFVAFSPDGKRLASAADDGMVKLWDLASKKELFSAADMLTNSNQIRFSPDGKALVTISSNREIVVLDTETGKVLRKFAAPEMTGGPQCVDLSPDGKTIAVVGRGKLCLLSVADGKPIATYEVHKGYGVNAVAWSPDAKFLATTGTDKTAIVLNAGDGKQVKSWPVGLNGLCLAFSPDGKTVFVASDDKILRACDLSGDTPTVIIEKSVPLLSLATSRDGKTLVIGGPGHAPWLVSIADRKPADPALDADDWVKCAAISPDGAWLAGGANGGAVYLWKTPK